MIADDAWRFDAPVWSPDGKRLLYAADRDGKTVLQQVDLATNAATALTAATDASQFAPTFSPSGDLIAFTEQEAERSQIVLINRLSNQTALYLIKPDGTQLERLTHGMGDASMPRWSSDGQSTAFLRQDAGERSARLHLIRLADRTERQLADALVLGEPFAWSPDDAFIAFIAPYRSLFTALSIVRVSDGRVFQVVQGGQLSQLAWAD